jgi:hypothetical protein
MRAEAKALKRARRYPAWLWAKRLSTCRKEARTITIITMAAMMVSDRTREKPERLSLIVNWGKITVNHPRGKSKDWLFAFVPKD